MSWPGTTTLPGRARHNSQMRSMLARLIAGSKVMSAVRESSSARFLAASPVKITS